MRRRLSGPATISPIVTSTLLLLAASSAFTWSILEIEIHHVHLTQRLCTKQMLCDLRLTYNLLSQPGTEQKMEFTLANVTNWKEERQIRRRDTQLKYKQTFRRKFSSNDWDQVTLQTTLRLTAPGRRYSPMNIQTSVSRLLALAPHAIVAPYHELQLTGSGIELSIYIRGYCEEGFYGRQCENTCSTPLGFHPEHIWCDQSTVYCRQGWTGLLCEQRDPCSQPNLVICQNDARCHPIYTPGQVDGETAAFRCNCQPGWTGPLCAMPELEYCRNEDRSYGTFRKSDFNWLDDKLHTVLVEGNRYSEFPEPYCLSSSQVGNRWRPYILAGNQKGATKPQGMFRSSNVQPGANESLSSELTEACEKWRESPKPRVQGMWRLIADPSGTTPTVEVNRPQMLRMWRLNQGSPGSSPSDEAQLLEDDWNYIYVEPKQSTGDIDARLSKIVTRMEPLPPVMATYNKIPECPRQLFFAEADKFGLDEIRQGFVMKALTNNTWTQHCYQMPCLLLQGHYLQPLHTKLYVTWRQALISAFPYFVNMRPSVKFTLIILRDKSAITSINFDCTANGVPMTLDQLNTAFFEHTIENWIDVVKPFSIKLDD
ncbi:hypothetical protein EG68_05346 [Paragonimus skrjabini miyazakii]|uniref:EGF-like domain-containing protein n=1 Tax=Paragonimus skrjabini miyazakii TaxID=59628 RepID=A0A8S9YBY5_9TREM|nr:hypothetical protein EG68_05346 [Paragonimus skrjabini miyazakii]